MDNLTTALAAVPETSKGVQVFQMVLWIWIIVHLLMICCTDKKSKQVEDSQDEYSSAVNECPPTEDNPYPEE